MRSIKVNLQYTWSSHLIFVYVIIFNCSWTAYSKLFLFVFYLSLIIANHCSLDCLSLVTWSNIWPYTNRSVGDMIFIHSKLPFNILAVNISSKCRILQPTFSHNMSQKFKPSLSSRSQMCPFCLDFHENFTHIFSPCSSVKPHASVLPNYFFFQLLGNCLEFTAIWDYWYCMTYERFCLFFPTILSCYLTQFFFSYSTLLDTDECRIKFIISVSLQVAS